MSRLIDADDLIKILEENNQKLEEQIKDARTKVQKVVYEAQLFTAKGIVEVIKEQPTAYDLDKVVKELEKLKDKAQLRREELIELNSFNNIIIKNIEYERGRVYAFDDAIDIVKAGGRDE